MIEGLFPCPIGVYELGRSLTQSEMSYLKGITMEKNQGNTVSENGDILHNDIMADFTKFIGNSIDEYCKQTYDFDTDKVQLYITQSWTNLTKKGEFHHMHNHQNSIISGVFYFEGNKDDVIEFYNPNPWLGDRWAVDAKANNDFNSQTYWWPADIGTLILFPSQLEHAVPEVEGDRDRYSMSFNTFFRGQIGGSHERTELIL